jgi:hypothetical protein
VARICSSAASAATASMGADNSALLPFEPEELALAALLVPSRKKRMIAKTSD